MAWFRSLIFSILFYSATLLLSVVTLCVSWFGGGPVGAVAESWARIHRWCARWILGQRIVVEGAFPPGAHFIVLKHEAMFETIDLLCLLHRPAIAAKRELFQIPIWGRAARNYGLVPVDRAAGAKALRQLRSAAVATLASGRSLCMFPEGTRVPHGEAPPLKAGFAGLYSLLNLPIIPVALDSGRLNRRGRFIRMPGIIRYRIGDIVPPGLPRAEAESRVHAAINSLNDSEKAA